jgi:hypothetical protein
MRRYTAIPLLFVAALLLSMLSHAAFGQHVHVLVVANTGDGGKGRRATITDVQSLFQRLVPSNQYTIKVRESGKDNYDARSIQRDIKNTRVARNDTFVFFFHGHGGRSGGHHFLNMPDGGKLWSADLQDTVRAMPCHLRLILTSACNVSVRAAPALIVQPWNVNKDGIAPVMEELFINHSGLLHMNGAYPGQLHFSDDGGAWFFQALLGYINANPTDRPTWRDMDRRMDRLLDERFRTQFPNGYEHDGTIQRTLYPVSWELPQSARRRRSRFGIGVW